jgi:hypothetical protein
MAIVLQVSIFQAVGSILSSLFFPLVPFILQLAGKRDKMKMEKC